MFAEFRFRSKNAIPTVEYCCFWYKVLIPNETQKVTFEFDREFLTFEQHLYSEFITTDLKQNLFGAFDNVFTGVRIRGWFIRFWQCMWNKIHKTFSKTRQKYIINDWKSRHLMALIFSLLVKIFDEWMLQCFFYEELLLPLVNYFEPSWGSKDKLKKIYVVCLCLI